MKVAIAAGAIEYSMRIAVPVGKSTPGPHGPSGKRVSTTSGRKCRRHLGHTEHHRQVHTSDDNRRDEKATETTFGQTVVPAGVVTGNHIADTQPRKQHPPCCSLSECSFLQIRIVFRMEVCAVVVCTRGTGVFCRLRGRKETCPSSESVKNETTHGGCVA